MTIDLRQSTASQEVMIGPFVDSADGATAKTALTIANTDIRIQKAGGTTFANKNSGGASHVENGYYLAVLDATDTDTPGSGIITVRVAGALPIRIPFRVLPAIVYDAMLLATEFLPVDPNKQKWSISGGTLTAKKPDGTTDAYTRTVAGTSGALPVTSVT